VLGGNGDGTFGAPRDFATHNVNLCVVVADLNADGRPDLAACGSGDFSPSPAASVLLGNGDGTFGARAFVAGDHPMWVEAADLDGDGHPDLVLAREWGSLDKVWEGDFYLWGRTATALLGTLTIYLVYRAGLRWGWTVALVASSMMAIHPHLVREAHYALTDTPLTFFLALTLLLSLVAAEDGRLRWFALAGLTAKALPFNTISAGLAGLARVAVTGELGAPKVAQLGDKPGSFAVTVPATLDLVVKLGAESRLGADVEIDLALTPRFADPLLLVIDLAPVKPEDVRIVTRAGGLGATIAPILEVALGEIRRQVARSLSSILDSEKVRAGRTIDVAARIEGRPDPVPPNPWVWVDDATWGERFLRAAVTPARLTEGFAKFSGTPLSIGPLQAGPRDKITISAEGAVGTPSVKAAKSEDVSFDAAVPLDLDLVVAVGRENRYRCTITVGLHPVVRPADPLAVVLDIPPIVPDEVKIDVAADGHLASIIGKAGHLEAQLRTQVVQNVNSRLGDASNRTFDVGARIDEA